MKDPHTESPMLDDPRLWVGLKIIIGGRDYIVSSVEEVPPERDASGYPLSFPTYNISGKSIDSETP
jgi:hypothetical protein